MNAVRHPSSIDLEAFACGESMASVSSHVGDCDTCRTFVDRLKGALAAGPSKKKASDFVARIAAAAESKPKEATVTPIAKPRRSWTTTASAVLVPLAIAAAVIVFLRSPSDSEKTSSFVPKAPVSASVPEPAVSVAQLDPENTTSFKGGIQIAVVRERAGQQIRFTGTVRVRPGDRLRVEVALDREQAILGAVLGDDGSWLELMSVGVRRSGTHFSERSARVDSDPMRGTILVGTPEALKSARETKRFDDVSTVRVEWESP